jgi:4a-hydroxytetrahydrobiopterin dehydratase
MSRTAMPTDEAAEKAQRIPRWTMQDSRLHRVFEFDGFVAAFGFMARAAIEAEKLNHHPDWRNVYNRVEVTLWTHDAGGLTGLDFRLAEIMDRIADGTGLR